MGYARAIFCILLVACGSPEDPADAGHDASEPGCGECDDGVFCNGVEVCTDDACAAGVPPCGFELCDEESDACACGDPDVDDDGASSIECGGADCDDENPARFAGALEICDVDDRDEDCDPRTFGVRDGDGDGEPDVLCCNVEEDGTTRNCGSDCDDTLSGVNPSAPEVCNGRDDDCDDIIDELVVRTFSPDADADGFGDPDSPTMTGCNPPEGHVENATDCDDTNPFAHSESDPEVCDSQDNDCDGVPDDGTMPVTWYRDVDGDTYGDEDDPSPVTSCLPVADHVPNALDCNDSVAAVNPSASESCNSRDDDCDGMIDDGVRSTYCADVDGDRHGNPRDTRTACRAPSGYVALCDDCNDVRATTYPGATELCNNRDDNCSEGGGAITSEDRDADGHSSPTAACTGGYPRDDCVDTNSDVYPGAGFQEVPRSCGAGTWCPNIACCSFPGAPCGAGCSGNGNWDYNCDGDETMRAEAWGRCIQDPDQIGACVGSGPIYDDDPTCGEQGMYIECRWNPLMGSCARITSTQPLPCR